MQKRAAFWNIWDLTSGCVRSRDIRPFSIQLLFFLFDWWYFVYLDDNLCRVPVMDSLPLLISRQLPKLEYNNYC